MTRRYSPLAFDSRRRATLQRKVSARLRGRSGDGTRLTMKWMAGQNAGVPAGGTLSAEMGPAHRPFVSTLKTQLLPDVCGPRAYYRRKGYGHRLTKPA